MPNEPLVDVQAAARYLGVSVSAMNLWRSKGIGPAFYKVGALVKYRISELGAWLDSRRRSSTAKDASA